jgi:hypothetical protein
MLVKRSNGKFEECKFAGLHPVLCGPAIEAGFCQGGCTDFILARASARSALAIADAILRRRPAAILQFNPHS